MPANRKLEERFKIREKERQRKDDGVEEGKEEGCINLADVEHGSLIDINGTFFRHENSPGFSRRPRGAIVKALGSVREELSEKKMGFDRTRGKTGTEERERKRGVGGANGRRANRA